jgi:hypothetical protein
MDVFGEISRAVAGFLGARPLPPPSIVVATALIAGAVVVYRPIWALVRHVVTIAHEGGHAAIAALTGRRLRGVRLHSDTSGLTISAGKRTGFGVVLTLLGGYLAPSLLGLLGAVTLSYGRVLPVLWAAVLLLLALLLVIRNLFGVVSVVLTGALLVAVAGWAPPTSQGPAAYVLVWFLLIAAPRPVVELQLSRRRGLAPSSDADQLAPLTGLPAFVWVLVFLSLTLAALVGGGWLLASPVLAAV